MVVDDLDVHRTAVVLLETDPPLIVAPDAPLTRAVFVRLFEPVARRYAQRNLLMADINA